MYIIAGLDADEAEPFVAVTTPGANVASAIKTIVGIGNRYYAFASIPFDFSNGINVNFDGAATCSSNTANNSAAIIAMLETPPLDKISAP